MYKLSCIRISADDVARFVAQKASKKKNPLTVSGGKHKVQLRLRTKGKTIRSNLR